NKLDENLCGALVKIRRQAIKELKEAAYDLGCNAVIGVDFDYLTMDPQHAGALNATVTVYEPYVICVTANGNAVVIEKEE
ncbi:MAG: heavy metal-binding domain-containing protein, partial [Lachnospiraceae bacterium]|nr:heavy metal-binding domain-containing protein [Lachnospiraceae bacterium]